MESLRERVRMEWSQLLHSSKLEWSRVNCWGGLGSFGTGGGAEAAEGRQNRGKCKKEEKEESRLTE